MSQYPGKAYAFSDISEIKITFNINFRREFYLQRRKNILTSERYITPESIKYHSINVFHSYRVNLDTFDYLCISAKKSILM